MLSRDELERQRDEAFQAKMAARLEQAKAALNGDSDPAPVIQCETCGDTGAVIYNVPVGHELFGKFQPCPNPRCAVANECHARAWAERIRLARIPDEYRRFTFDTWAQETNRREREQKDLAEMALRFFISCPGHYFALSDAAAAIGMELEPGQYGRARNSIMLTGNVGMGKTGLMVAAVNALLEQGEAALYMRVADYIESVKDTFDPDSENKTSEITQLVKTAPLLALDEFNVAQATPWRVDLMESVIRYRYSAGLPTLMTANVDQDGFRDMWGIRTADPAIAMAHWVYIGGVKLRKTAQTAREG